MVGCTVWVDAGWCVVGVGGVVVVVGGRWVRVRACGWKVWVGGVSV